MTGKEQKSLEDLARYLQACLFHLGKAIQPGQRGEDLKKRAVNFLAPHRGKRELYCLHINVNQVVCHHPPEAVVLREGDILTLDMVLRCDQGLFADGAWTFLCGPPREGTQELVKKAWEVSRTAFLSLQPGGNSLAMKKAIHNSLVHSPFALLEEGCGHGIGRLLHMDPILNFSLNSKEDIPWKEGQCFTIEPLIAPQGSEMVLEEGDIGYIKDQGDAAYFEHMVGIWQGERTCYNLPGLVELPEIDPLKPEA